MAGWEEPVPSERREAQLVSEKSGISMASTQELKRSVSMLFTSFYIYLYASICTTCICLKGSSKTCRWNIGVEGALGHRSTCMQEVNVTMVDTLPSALWNVDLEAPNEDEKGSEEKGQEEVKSWREKLEMACYVLMTMVYFEYRRRETQFI